MHRVWISSAGTGNAFATALAIKRHFPDTWVLSSDINPSHLVTTSLYSDKHIVSPPVDKDYAGFIEKTVNEFQIDTYLPFMDAEITIAATAFAQGKVPGSLRVQVKDPAIAGICEDKLKTYAFLASSNLPTPLTSAMENPFASTNGLYILKPRRGFGSQVRIVDQSALSSSTLEREEYVVQEICREPEVTVDVAWSKEFDVFHYLCRERIQTKTGVCTKAKIFQDDQLGQIARQLAEKLQLHSFCFQVMELNGRWAITDVNPRLGAGTAICTVAGSDFFSAMLSILWGQNPQPYLNPLKKECFVTRQYSEFLMHG